MAAFPRPSIAINANALTRAAWDSASFATSGLATVLYSVNASGPDDNVMVPLLLPEKSALDSSGNNKLQVGARNASSVQVSGYGVSSFSWNYGTCSGNISPRTGCGRRPFSGAMSTQTSIGWVISLAAYVSDDAAKFGQDGLGDSNSSPSALIDPSIAIDPAWLSDHPGYQPAPDAEIGNGPVVPEPDAVTMLLRLAAPGGWQALRVSLA